MERLYFIRIGGTAMGGVAAACQALGDEVWGSEEVVYEPMKSYLAAANVTVLPTFDPAQIAQVNPDRIVVGNAVIRTNPELEAALNDRRRLISLPQLISERLIDRNRSIVVTGTHGKTTTTAMTAWLLEHGGKRPGFMIGGVPGNFDVSCRPSPDHNNGGLFVIEGDEYDCAYFDKRSKFLWYRSDILVLNNLEFDHADIFEDLEAIKKSFRLLLRMVPSGGLVLAHDEDINIASVLEGWELAPIQTFGYSEAAYWRAVDVSEDAQGVTFTVQREGVEVVKVSSPINGRHNVRNMLAAIATALHIGIPPTTVAHGVAAFRMPKRRMEEIGTWQGATVVDDFAHHPTAIVETLRAIHSKYPGRRVHVVFEPRSNTTTRNVVQKAFETCFDTASSVMFGALDRPWRYAEAERLDTKYLSRLYEAKGIRCATVNLDQGKELDWGKYAEEFLRGQVREGDIVMLGSNGDLGGLRARLIRVPNSG